MITFFIPGRPVPQAKNAVYLHLGQIEQARRLVKTYHYSRRWPSNVQMVATWHENGGLFGDSGEAFAACVFTIPPTRWSEDVWELARLVRKEEDGPPLTGLIAQACKWAKRKGAHLLVSFADETHGHHGGVYRAASWQYAGLRPPSMDGLIVNGRFIPGRAANNIWGTRSPSKLATLNVEAEPHYDAGKHLYWRALTREGQRRAERLGLVT